MNDTQVNPRQAEILTHLLGRQATRAEIETSLNGNGSRITTIRDLNFLIDLGWVVKAGQGKYFKYQLSSRGQLLAPVDLDKYFIENTDTRQVSYPKFNFELVEKLNDLITSDELKVFEQGRSKLTEKFSSLDKTLLKRELERFTIELSWKSSQIEGNTYSLLETEELIKNSKEAQGHSQSEAIMILNHKSAFDTMLAKKKEFEEISILDIRTIHVELLKNLDIKLGIREGAVGITGTKYVPLDNKFQIEDELQKFVTVADQAKSIPEKALIYLATIAYLQPFYDGNKRTSRMVSNAILIANNYHPLSYRSVDEVEYKKALIMFYEQNNLFHLKRIFLEQQEFAINNYFL